MAKPKSKSSKKHHLHSTGRLAIDKRAKKLAAEIVKDDGTLLTTSHLAEMLGCSTQWCEIARGGDYGPPFVYVGNHLVRYRPADVKAWLESRVVKTTAEKFSRIKLGRRERAEA